MTRCYSQRMLNPYHGLVNVVEVHGADAVSRDGLNWVLYIQGGFETEVMDDGSRPDNMDDRVDPAKLLAERVNAAAGKTPRALWFRRQADGSGAALSPFGETLSSAAFPELLLRDVGWERSEDAALVMAYLAWQAPWLLALQGISRCSRVRLEQAARSQALLLDRLYHTYPEVLDDSALKAARVEASLRRSVVGSQRKEEAEDISFFVSGN